MADRPADGTFDLEAYERSIQDKNVPNHGKVFKKKHDSDDEDMAEEKKDTGNDWSDVDSDGVRPKPCCCFIKVNWELVA